MEYRDLEGTLNTYGKVLFNEGTNCFCYFLFRCIACHLRRQNSQNKSGMHSKGESLSAKTTEQSMPAKKNYILKYET
jgi:hypothetical protein